ncbi:V-snare-domain-containing protein [Violaceomyces palustris]|uniref:V-snare-domain-containing protein n=1 Tax=Violaceomyces palustris TaxID=1673888 RepID=A0ACD0P8L0_9BASI|nr:V-snare-domain-containing protein [Violaceomyces palustris]
MSVPQKSWETSRKRTRNLESTIDARLTTYSQLASRIASSSSEIDYTALDMDGASFKGQDDEHKALENELDDLLNQLSSSVDELTSILDDPTVPPTTSQLHAIQRHREVLMDFTKDYRRSKTNVRHAIDRRDLMGTVRGDIDAYKARHASDADALLAERGRIDNSHQMIDSTLDQAYATRADFASQGSMLNDISTRMGTTAAQVPGLNSIITLIGRRRRRDSVIMGCLIGTCTVLLLMFMTR